MSALGIYWIIENPTSSIVFWYDRMRVMFQNHENAGVKMFHTHTWMGMWGGDSPKGMKLIGTWPSVFRVSMKLDRRLKFTRDDL
eukprot:746470-Karenia_brevis.AAC.1